MIEIKKLKNLFQNYYKLQATFKTKDEQEYEGTYIEGKRRKI